jgi:proteasome lid subunit RPN8/RPN11
VSTLRLSADLRRMLETWAREGYPNERCGLLLGRMNGSLSEVREVLLARNVNVSRARDRYELDPEDFIRADAQARAAEMEIVGIWHTHPDHPARPSQTDRENAWCGWSYVILSVGSGGVNGIRSWRLDGAEFVEEDLEQ